MRSYGIAAVCRLSVEPTTLADGQHDREVVVEHTPHDRTGAVIHRAKIGWAGIATRDECERARFCIGETVLTETAAIVIGAAVVSEYESAEVISVLQIGSGGDFRVEVDWRKKPVQLEVSGLLRDDTPSGADTRARVGVKCRQVGEGFVSVTAFHHQPSGTAHTVLRFTRPPKRKGKRR